MKQFKNLAEATTYHRNCYVCGERLIHGLKIGLNPEDPPVFKWNLSENVDSDTDDWLTIDSHTNTIKYVEQNRRYSDDLIYSGNDMVDRVRRYSGTSKNYNGLLYESIQIHCPKCHQFSYTIQVVINATAMRLDGIFLNSEFISHEEKNGDLHEVRNVYAIDKTEYSFVPKYRHETEGIWRKDEERISIPLIPLDLRKPDETIARIRKLNIFS